MNEQPTEFFRAVAYRTTTEQTDQITAELLDFPLQATAQTAERAFDELGRNLCRDLQEIPKCTVNGPTLYAGRGKIQDLMRLGTGTIRELESDLPYKVLLSCYDRTDIQLDA